MYNPLQVPAEYRSFYAQWKSKTILSIRRLPPADPACQPPAAARDECTDQHEASIRKLV